MSRMRRDFSGNAKLYCGHSLGFHSRAMRLFYSGPVVNAELLVAMLEKHGIAARREFENPSEPDEEDLNRVANVFVAEPEYERAHRLFYGEREDEL